MLHFSILYSFIISGIFIQNESKYIPPLLFCTFICSIYLLISVFFFNLFESNRHDDILLLDFVQSNLFLYKTLKMSIKTVR